MHLIPGNFLVPILAAQFLAMGAAALAQEPPVARKAPQAATVPSGIPLRVALERRVRIKRAGQAIQGRLVDPIYVYDRLAIPAGSVVEGHIAAIGGVPIRRRLTAILSGNLTPPRDVRAQFDTLLLGEGSRLSLRTSPSRGTAHTARISKPRKQPAQPKSAFQGGPDAVQNRAAMLAFKTPGKMRRLETYALGMLPYHPQAWSAGTLFSGVLQDPVMVPPLSSIEARTASPAAAGPEPRELRARLLTPINSATTRRGATIEAVVTRPQFSTDHRLLIPEGSRLLGEVVMVQKARLLHRNGKLLFVFRQIHVPPAPVKDIQAYLEGIEADWAAHLTLDSEGAAQTSSPKTRFIFPAIAVAVAALSFHQDYNAQGVPDLDSAGRAESGAVGLGLIGTLVAQISRPVASGIAITGAAFSLYSNFIARGQNVVLPANTPLTIGLTARGGEAAAGKEVK